MKKKIKLSKKQRGRLIKEFGHIPTKEEIFKKILESQERLAQSLKGAWETRPDDPNVEKELLDVGEKVAKFRSSLKNAFKNNKSNS